MEPHTLFLTPRGQSSLVKLTNLHNYDIIILEFKFLLRVRMKSHYSLSESTERKEIYHMKNITKVVFFFINSAIWAAVILLTPALVNALEKSFQRGFSNFTPTWNATIDMITLRYVLIALLAGVIINLVAKLINMISSIRRKGGR